MCVLFLVCYLDFAANQDGAHVAKAVVDAGCHLARTEVNL